MVEESLPLHNAPSGTSPEVINESYECLLLTLGESLQLQWVGELEQLVLSGNLVRSLEAAFGSVIAASNITPKHSSDALGIPPKVITDSEGNAVIIPG